MAEPTVSAGFPKALVDFATARGVPRDVLIQGAGIDPSLLSDQDNRVSLKAYQSMLALAVEQSGDPAFALRFGEGVPMQDVTIVGLIGQTAETTGEAGEQIARYTRLMIDESEAGPASQSGLVRDGGRLWIAHPGPRDKGYFAEASLARSVTGAWKLLGSTPYFQAGRFPRAVHFTHAAPEYVDEYERIFKAPIVFGSERNALLVDEDFVSIRLPTSNRYVFGVFSDRAEALLKELEGSSSIRGRVEALLFPILHKGEANITAIASRLGLSRQTLYRRLKQDGVTFEQVLDSLRRQLADHYLSSRKLSVNEAAYLLGFSDPAAFSRAFKRWTGSTPKTFRENSRRGL